MLLATLMLTAACNEDESLSDKQEQAVPGQDEAENENEDNEAGGNGDGISLLQGTESMNVRIERIDSSQEMHTLDYAEQIGLGSQQYELARLD